MVLSHDCAFYAWRFVVPLAVGQGAHYVRLSRVTVLVHWIDGYVSYMWLCHSN